MHAVAADGHALLALWEQALPLAGPAREALLARHESGDAPATVGAQRLLLLGRLGDELGGRAALRSRCPACGEEAGFAVDLRALASQLTADDGRVHELVHGTWTVAFRLPAPADLVQAAGVDDFVAWLLDRCVLQASRDGHAQPAAALPEELQHALSDAMDALDPAAHLAFALGCPSCGHAWSASFDAAGALWSRVQGGAERLLVDIDTLARRHGWTEAEILALSPARRRAYLQLARAE